jgi:adenylate cyclase
LSDSVLRQRLVAIMAADAVGYSRLMASDEHATLTALDAARAQFSAHVQANHGRVIDMAGDSVLAVFETAIGAASAALAVQQAIHAESAGVPEDRRMLFRVGIHLGDVIEKADGTVYGDGVNIAARLQALAPVGGVSVSDSIYHAIKGKLAASFADQGAQQVKNIAEPVHAFHMLVAAGALAPEPAVAQAGGAKAVAGAPGKAPLARTDKPAIAVLPLNNMSGDAEQEYFADGITEDIITELSRFRDLFVISRNSTFKYKGQPINVQKVAAELGVNYVLEGSVRKAGNRIRITVQLIDAASDTHVWAERYDRELADIFAIQDELTSTIVSILPGRVEAASGDRAARKTTDNLAAYECLLTGKRLHHHSRREDNPRALQLLNRAIELDPSYAHAHAWRACTLGQAWVNGWCEDPEAAQVQILESLQTALSLDPNDSDVHRILAAINLVQRNHDACLFHQQRALSLNANDDLVVVQQGEILTWKGEPVEGIEWVLKAMRLNPYHPERFWGHLGRAYFTARRYADAVAAVRHMSKLDPGQHASLAGCLAQAGDAAQARKHADLALAGAPDFSVVNFVKTLHYFNEADFEHVRASMLQAGLPA